MKTTMTLVTMLVVAGCVGGADRSGGGSGLTVAGGGGSDCATAVFRYDNLAACGAWEPTDEAGAESACQPTGAWDNCVIETTLAADCLEGESCETQQNCEWAIDAQLACLEEAACAEGTGPCANEGCTWVDDGECDEPEGTNLCPEGTDSADCGGAGPSPSGFCPPEWIGDGECDEPEGTGLCDEGTDAADCGGGGPGGACDPASCSGSDTECTDYGCVTCWYSCNGDTCDSTCSDSY